MSQSQHSQQHSKKKQTSQNESSDSKSPDFQSHDSPLKNSAYQSLLPILSFIKPYRRQVFLALFFLLFTATVSLSLGQGVKMVIDNGFIAGSSEQLTQTILVLIGMICLLAFGTFFRFYLMSWLGERVSADIRTSVFNKIIRLHPSYFEENRSGELMSRLTTDTTLLQSIIGSSFSMALRSFFMLLGGLVMLLVTNFKLTMIVVVCVPLILIPMLFFGRRVRDLASTSQDAIADIGTYAGEIIQNIKVVQSYNHEALEEQAFGGEVEKAFEVAKKRIMQRSFLFAAVILLTFAAISVMLWVGGMDVLAGNMSGGELGAFVFYAVMVATSVATVAEVYGELQRAAGSATRLLELLSLESAITSPLSPFLLPNRRSEKKTESKAKSKIEKKAEGKNESIAAISFNNLDFYYPSRPDIAALKNINLTIEQGQTVALVGPSGAGKTTMFELLQRFYDPQQGNVSLHGISIEQLSLSQLRDGMGMVPQHPVLFSSDVMHNIAYGKPDASKNEIIDAAKRAHAHEFIEQLPQGYNSFLGEQGVRLSGGQKQRVAIARAILKDPDVLLLDEATSALDAQSEFHVQAALNELMVNRTTIIIAHRLATVIHADKIVVMDDGKIMDTGTHQTLLQTSSLYQRLCELQFEQGKSE